MAGYPAGVGDDFGRVSLKVVLEGEGVARVRGTEIYGGYQDLVRLVHRHDAATVGQTCIYRFNRFYQFGGNHANEISEKVLTFVPSYC